MTSPGAIRSDSCSRQSPSLVATNSNPLVVLLPFATGLNHSGKSANQSTLRIVIRMAHKVRHERFAGTIDIARVLYRPSRTACSPAPCDTHRGNWCATSKAVLTPIISP
jgi:hypothetical protein